MAILIDLSQVLLSSLFAHADLSDAGHTTIEPNLIRHISFDCIYSYKQKFSAKYGRLIICMDNRNYWRKQEFPYYKANRKKARDESGLDWKMILNTLSEIKSELTEFFPYQTLNIPLAEADDVIAVIAKKYHTAEKILILSGDKDFSQLQIYPNIYQYAPIQKKFITVDNPDKEKRIHIMKGDIGDGIPNFLSADDCLVKKIRQKSLSTKKLEMWSGMPPERFCNHSMLCGFKRNETLIDFNKIPEDLQNNILAKFDEPFKADSSKLFDYFQQHRMKMLMEKIGEF